VETLEQLRQQFYSILSGDPCADNRSRQLALFTTLSVFSVLPVQIEVEVLGIREAMGGQVSKLMSRIFGSKEMRILMLGLDAAGKTTILYKLKLNQDVTTIPTVGFNVESVTYKNVKFNVWDVGGQDKIRPLWRHYYSGTQGLIFVIDSSDTARMDEARSELHKIIGDREMKDALLLVFANKQDINGHLSPEEVTNALQLNQLRDRLWYVVPSVATQGTGIFEGLAWLSNNVKSQPMK